MKKPTFWIALLALVLASPLAEAARTGPRYLIKLKDPSRTAEATAVLAQHGLTVQRTIPELDLVIAHGKTQGLPSPQQLQALRDSGQFVYAEKNMHWYASRTPDDSRYWEQYEIRRLDIERAWNKTTGSQNVIVAVTDSGILLNHPDLKSQLWTNPAGGSDLHGYNFVNQSGDPTDDHGHGTHVSGIIGADADNSQGVAGVNWRVQIMALKFMDSQGSGRTDLAIDAILYATKHGARIINASWGGPLYSDALKDAIDYAYDHGVLMIAASGNDAVNADTTPSYPAAYRIPGVLSVASSYGDGILSNFSNYGVRTVGLAAPGSSVLSTTNNGEYGRKSGTSMASPMVAGVGALMLAVHPELTPLQLRNALLNATIERSAYASTLATSGDLSASLAVEQLDPAGLQLWPTRMTVGVGETFQFTAYKAKGAITWTSSDSKVASVDSKGIVTGQKNGSATLTARDASGATASTQWVHVVTHTSPPTGGCNGRRQSGLPEDVSAAACLVVPFMIASLARRATRVRAWARGKKKVIATLLLALTFPLVAQAADPKPARPDEEKKEPDFKRLSIDIGGSSNFSSTSSVYEFNLGVNFYVMRWLVWRNAPFVRAAKGFDTAYGLDSSLIGRYELEVVEGIAATPQLGAGYRFTNQGRSTPFVETGAAVRLRGLSVGATAKWLLNSAVGNGASNEVLYSLSFSGSFSPF